MSISQDLYYLEARLLHYSTTSVQLPGSIAHHARTLHTPAPADKSPDTTPLRPITHAFDPAENTPLPHASPFSTIRPISLAQDQRFERANTIYPPSHCIPWPSLLPAAFQSKYWRQAEAAATGYLQAINAHHPTLLTHHTARTKKLVDTAVSYATNLVPLSSITRMQLLAKTYILLFLHDDAVDTRDSTLTIPPRSAASQRRNSKAKYLAYDILAQEILAEDPHEGKRLLEECIAWGSATGADRPGTFASLDEYIEHGLKDFGAELILQTVRFSCGDGVGKSGEESQELEPLKALCAKHLLLTNDLYSYAKEVRAEAEGGEVVLNAVRVLRGLIGGGCDDALARRLLRLVIRDLEERMSAECLRVEQLGHLSEMQMVYARAVIVAVAGNMFFSATSPRYAGAVEGTKLA
ncbi:uncharacterized protein BP01DRAFT_412653 [Aspergillus saccharolyticus JOP 1030-1]|uniref:Terpenoid synthase n=1 Tax=Aspergillus saccharolyticus JOP 1030-1 TaxID=1450539 RepID=A0A318ZST1_9EURO|nr:terpenoid synthase [Aspergillus saccharolyticus JOP 1030-1]PYH49755.1 terpenoid synthase [Aspergillus saccharolyticus JOP 1030-1]